MAYIDKISVNGSERDLRDAGAARFDETQSLTDVQKQAARANVGAASAADVTALAGRMTTAEGDIDALGTDIASLGGASLSYYHVTQTIANTEFSNKAANLRGNTFSWVYTSWFTDVPDIGLAWVGTIANAERSYAFATQLLFSPEKSVAYVRRYQSTWRDWVSLDSNNINNSLTNASDLNTVTDANTYYAQYGLTAANTPYTDTQPAYILQTYTRSTLTIQQIFDFTGRFYSRYKVGSGSWTAWAKYDDSSYIKNMGILATESDLDDISGNVLYGLNSLGNYGNTPDGFSYGFLQVMVYNATFRKQIVYDMTGNKTWTRFHSASGWSAWEGDKKIYTAQKKYIAIGDSITYGQTSDGTTRATNPYPKIVGERLGLVTQNEGVKGMGFINREYAGGVTFYEKVQTVDFSDAALVTIAGGINDTAYPLGTHTDASEAATICGQMKACIEWILNHSNLYTQIVVISPMRTSVGFNHIYPGGWSIKGDTDTSYEHEVGLLCASMNVPVVGWSDATLCQHWTSICTDNVHPNNEAYNHMGQYIAGKVSQFFN